VKPSKEFTSRYEVAKKYRDDAERDIRDALKFCANGRESDFTSTTSSPEPEEIFSTYAEEAALDFASDLVTYYTPPEARWADLEATLEVDQDELDEETMEAILGLVKSREDKLFSLIEGSNYYDVAPQVFFEASHGTMAMWVQQSHIAQPIYCEPVPPHELLIAPGHNGYLDRFREVMVRSQHLKATLDGLDVDLSDHDIKKKTDKPGAIFKVCWGFWLDWSDPAVPFWRFEVTVDGKRVTEEAVELGPLAGSCPLMVGRFNPQPKKPWGRGPALKALADIFTVDKVNETILTALDYALGKSYVYPDDGILDMSQGLKPNTAYPAAPGTAGSIQELSLAGDLDVGWLAEERLAERIRVAFYQDGPRQRGDTPPSATQWVDEARRVQRRIGKPSAPIWSEFVLPFLQRVEYLAVETGQIEATITHAGARLNIKPVSPLQKAQNQDKVLTTRSNLDLGMAAFGEAFPQVVDVVGTMKNIIDASGDELIVLNKQAPNETTPQGPVG